MKYFLHKSCIAISPYNLGGSVTQQPMAYQLGGLLKYKRSPMMG